MWLTAMPLKASSSLGRSADPSELLTPITSNVSTFTSSQAVTRTLLPNGADACGGLVGHEQSNG